MRHEEESRERSLNPAMVERVSREVAGYDALWGRAEGARPKKVILSTDLIFLRRGIVYFRRLNRDLADVVRGG